MTMNAGSQDSALESAWVKVGALSKDGTGLEFFPKDILTNKYVSALSKVALGSLLRPHSQTPLKRSFSTMLNESQLRQDHGLQIAGHIDAEQWLMPASFDDEVSPYLQVGGIGWASAFEDRIAALREAAVEEAITICEPSVVHARAAINRLHGAVRPSIFLLDGGNIRFVWHGEAGGQVGWQFLENGRIQFVMIGGSDAAYDKSYGEAGLNSSLRQLRAMGFSKAVFA